MVYQMDDETRKLVLGEALMDELKAIREYVEDVPVIKQQINKVSNDLDEIKDKLVVVNAVVRDHESDIKHLKQKVGQM